MSVAQTNEQSIRFERLNGGPLIWRTEVQTDPIHKLVVTGRAPFPALRTRAALRKTLFPARITRPGFRFVFVVEADVEATDLAQEIYRECPLLIGRATAVLAEVESTPDSIKEAAVKIATEQIKEKESYCFRLFKRGLHGLQENTPTIESKIGGAINAALQLKYGVKPIVNLSAPDVSINAEVLGPTTLVGILRKEWQISVPARELKPDENGSVVEPKPKEISSPPQL